MIDNPYSPLKIFHHVDRLEQLKQGKQIIPTQLQLIISDLCNHDCNFCAYRWSGYTSNVLFTKDAELASFGHNNPKRWIPRSKVFEILDDCVEMGIPSVQFTGGGEPTVHPNFGEVYSTAQSLGLQTALVTNGARLNRFVEMAGKSSWVRVSIDAGYSDTYASMRNISESNFQTVWNNIEELVETKKKDCILGIGFVVTNENWKGIIRCTKIARDAGCDNIRLSAVFQPEGEAYFDLFYKEAALLCKEAKDLETKDFKVFNLFGDRLQDLHQRSPKYSFCGYQQFNTYIGGDLNVYRCCGYAYNPRGLIGSLKEQSFKELWFSEEKQKDFQSFNAKDCEICQFNNKNETILYALHPNPAHINFV